VSVAVSIDLQHDQPSSNNSNVITTAKLLASGS